MMEKITEPASVRLGTWNTQWAVPGSAKGVRVSTSLAAPGCDILCVTEGSAGLLPGEDHIIDAGRNWGIPAQREDHRKVLLWSRSPWTEVDCLGSPDFPSGRFVKGVTETSIGPLTVVGVCIPWKEARVTRGRKRWEDHEAWLEAFERLPWRRTTDRMVVLGDFNQQVLRDMRRVRAPRKKKLRRAFDGLEISTKGEIPCAPGPAIDHIAHTGDLMRPGPIEIWPRRNSRDKRMSDHFGVWADFSLRDHPLP